MKAPTHLSSEAEEWLKRLSGHLRLLDPSLRREIVDGFRAHIVDRFSADGAIGEVLAEMGSPEDCARRVLEEQREATGIDSTRYRWGAKRVTQAVAFAFTLAATFGLLIIPSYVSVSESSTGETSVETLPLLSVVGAWYLAVLAIPVVLTAVPLIPKNRHWQLVSAVSTALLLAFVVVGSLSIGYYYVPAAIAAIVGVFLPIGQKNSSFATSIEP